MKKRRTWLYFTLIALAFLLGSLLLIYGPLWLLQLSGGVSGLERKETLSLIDDYRKTIAQILGGVGLITGAIFGWRQLANTERNLAILHQGQITERFTRAIEQLGHEKLEVRLGGIYALERIAKDSAEDYPTILDVLTAFVREKAPWTGEPRGDEQKRTRIVSNPPLPIVFPNTDTQAVLAVIGRLIRLYGKSQPLDLSFSDLRGADLSEFNLVASNFLGSSLVFANLRGAKMSQATLANADLSDAAFADADLKEAFLNGANCLGTSFHGAQLSGACLYAINLTKEQISSALTDVTTRLPEDFGPPPRLS